MESDSLKRALLGNISDLGPSLDPVGCRGGEEILNDKSLCSRADGPAAILGEQGGANLVVPEGERPPGHPSGTPSVGSNHRQEGLRVTADETVFVPSLLECPSIVQPEAEPLVYARGVRIPPKSEERRQIRLLDRP